MLSNDNPAEPQAVLSSDVKAGAAEAPVMDPRSPIEVASDGSGTVNDPSASDTKPPGYDDLELFA